MEISRKTDKGKTQIFSSSGKIIGRAFQREDLGYDIILENSKITHYYASDNLVGLKKKVAGLFRES